MQFAVPTALMWSLLAIPIVIFYILKIRLRRVPVSTVMFWNQIFDEKKPRSIWQKLRHLLSLLVQLFFLALLVFALADPFFNFEELNARRIVLVVDNSASMNATDEQTTRLDAAKKYGFDLIRGLRLRDEMAIVSAGSVPRVEMGLTSHQKTLREALGAIGSTDGPTHVSQAVELAQRLLSDHENPEVILLTDGCFAEADEYEQAEDIRLVTYGEETDNVAITQFQVRRSLIDTIGYQILVEVQNFSKEEIECRLEVNLPDELVDVVPLKLAADEKWAQVLDHTSANGGHLIAKLDVEDGLACDNRAVALLPKRRPQPVLLVSRGNLFLQSALAAIPLVDLSISGVAPETVPKGTIVVFDQQATEQVPAGNTFYIQPSKSTNFWKMGEEITDPIVTKQASDSALMTHVQLENVLMPKALSLEISTEHQVLAESLGKQPLYSSINHKNGKTLVLMVDLEKADLPLRTAFPIMITNAIAWFQGQQGELQQAISSGELVTCKLGDNANLAMTQNVNSSGANQASESIQTQVESQKGADEAELFAPFLKDPNGNSRPLPAGTAKLTVGPLDQCGVWEVSDVAPEDFGTKPPVTESESDENRPLFEFACNLANASESDIRVQAREEVEVKAGIASFLGGRPVWFYLVAIGFVLSAVEWFLYQRRWIS